MSTRPAVLQIAPATPSPRASRVPTNLRVLCVLGVLRVSSDPPFSVPPPARGTLSHRRIISEVIPQPAPFLTRPNPFRMHFWTPDGTVHSKRLMPRAKCIRMRSYKKTGERVGYPDSIGHA